MYDHKCTDYSIKDRENAYARQNGFKDMGVFHSQVRVHIVDGIRCTENILRVSCGFRRQL